MAKKFKSVARKLIWVCFILYIIALVYFLFFAERYGRTSNNTYRYNLVPFSEIKRYFIYYRIIGFQGFALNIIGNVFAFVPFGMCLPIMTLQYKKFGNVVLDGFIFTVSIETIQLLLKVGSFDVDDMILNTLGVVVGYWLYRLLRITYYHFIENERRVEDVHESIKKESRKLSS